ncbi:GlxA family transcriptional regulator [Metapseudomonas resinovorans]|uniref:Putative AraC family transcriptional regulator n=1 Tax=Metapseudomonas resinovorans NBRC 106553 TaxID=1245471 RepID=S6AFY9_METRE|nr:helix-turn-helix domain-containing protein [Pseudomonas resinovorans]BAN46835.1 putative AraC family transcriptional regulator [Pseudomonas resinovorans NBRC 106553]
MIRVALFVCPQTVCSSLAMADDAFRLANQLAGEPLFLVQRFSRDGQPVDIGMAEVRVDGGLELAEAANLIVLSATGAAVERTLAANRELLPWLAARPDTQQLASLCSSAFLLAASGRLDGRRATTHWALAPALRKGYPQVRLDAEALLTEDGNLFCSGGAQAGLDLCLHLIAWHGGDWLARRVAGALVFDLDRGRQSRFAPLLPAIGSEDPQIGPLLLWLERHLAEPLDLEALAARAHCSSRTLLRRFKAATGLTPNAYLQRLRISAAQTALRHPTRSLEQVAAQVGYADRATFAKLFKQLCGETPGAFRRKLRATP